MSSIVLVINFGLLLLKFQFVELVVGMLCVVGIVEWIGEWLFLVVDYVQVLYCVFKMLVEDGIDLQICGLVVVGYWVVYGGMEFYQLMLLDDMVIGKFEELLVLVLLYNLLVVLGIKVVCRLLVNVVYVVVFDMVFFYDLFLVVVIYVIDCDVVDRWYICCYGFYGILY